MYAIEFEATIKNGMIPIPKQHRFDLPQGYRVLNRKNCMTDKYGSSDAPPILQAVCLKCHTSLHREESAFFAPRQPQQTEHA